VTGSIPGGFLVVVKPPLGGLPVQAPVAAVARKPGQLDIWAVANDGHVLERRLVGSLRLGRLVRTFLKLDGRDTLRAHRG
jgi:hypothetical protein